MKEQRPISNLQELINGFKEERAKTQMTLGKLIDRLEKMDPALEMDGICAPHSYRGYYSDLAFKQCDRRKVADVLKDARGCVGKTFGGYKGGDFDMGRNTPVWIANCGYCGTRIMAINDDGTIVTANEKGEDE